MSVSCLYNKQGCVHIKILLSVAWVKPFSLIYILWCWDDNIVNSKVNKSNATSKRSHTISVWKLLGKDNTVPKKLIRVPHIIGFRTAFFGIDMSLWFIWIINLLTDKPWWRLWRLRFFVKLWSIWWYASSIWKDKTFVPNISRMGQYDVISWHGIFSHQGVFCIPLIADKNNFENVGSYILTIKNVKKLDLTTS